MADRQQDLDRIERALAGAREVLEKYTPGEIESRKKSGGSPVTDADLEIDAVLRETLPQPGEGWLSEETADDRTRLECRRVWIVDPLDGTREFVMGIPEWCVSIGLIEDGVPVAGGICNPATGQLILGAEGLGVTLNGRPAGTTQPSALDGARVHASRSEIGRGEWERFADSPIEVVPCGSVAYKLGLVAAGLTDATWTLVPKHEWDVAGGAALVRAGGGTVRTIDWQEYRFNCEVPKLKGFIAAGSSVIEEIGRFLELAPAR